MSYKLTGSDVLNYQHKKKFPKGAIKSAFFKVATLLSTTDAVLVWAILATILTVN